MLLLLPFAGTAQSSQVGNLQQYENDRLHFGGLIGPNFSSLTVRPAPDFYKFDTLTSITPKTGAGLDLCILGEFKVSDYFRLRFVPGLSLVNRKLIYHVRGKVSDYDFIKDVESNYLHFPLYLKLQSKRVYGNYASYLLGGFKYSRDLASDQGVNNNGLDPAKQVIKLKKNDYSFEAGAACEFYLPYCKLAIEIKAAFGLRDAMIHDNTIFSNSVERLNSKAVILSFTFEG